MQRSIECAIVSHREWKFSLYVALALSASEAIDGKQTFRFAGNRPCVVGPLAALVNPLVPRRVRIGLFGFVENLRERFSAHTLASPSQPRLVLLSLGKRTVTGAVEISFRQVRISISLVFYFSCLFIHIALNHRVCLRVGPSGPPAEA